MEAVLPSTYPYTKACDAGTPDDIPNPPRIWTRCYASGCLITCTVLTFHLLEPRVTLTLSFTLHSSRSWVNPAYQLYRYLERRAMLDPVSSLFFPLFPCRSTPSLCVAASVINLVCILPSAYCCIWLLPF